MYHVIFSMRIGFFFLCFHASICGNLGAKLQGGSLTAHQRGEGNKASKFWIFWVHPKPNFFAISGNLLNLY